MVRAGEIEHGARLVEHAEQVWGWSSPAGRVRAVRRARLIHERAGLAPGMHVLELGCGTGLFTRVFAQSGASITAIDVSPDLLAKARDHHSDGQIDFLLGDAEELSFPDEMFDRVVGSSILHHLAMERAMSEVHRVLKSGGRIAFAEPNMMNPQVALQRNLGPLRRWAGVSPAETAFFRWRLAKLLTRSGFHQVSVEPFDFLHPAVPRPLIATVRALGEVLECVPVLREISGSLVISAQRSDVVT